MPFFSSALPLGRNDVKTLKRRQYDVVCRLGTFKYTISIKTKIYKSLPVDYPHDFPFFCRVNIVTSICVESTSEK